MYGIAMRLSAWSFLLLAALPAGAVKVEDIPSPRPNGWAGEKLRYGSLFSSYATCPKCAARTVSASSRVEEEATTWHEGLRRIDERCEHCDYRRSFTRRIPRRPQPSTRVAVSSASAFSSTSSTTSSSSSSAASSSSSSGFGGGSSSGSGASGHW